ncbi:MAG: AarF/UbiB family protein, partial [Deltaproteobacteria bacterium]|nr:AarF/UbiB family protein [Deltaproteobacteria bacterium]
VFQELGPTFIKFGQILSMRPDLVPTLLVLELKKLQDQVPHAPQPAVQTLLEKALGRPLEAVFSEFNWTPIGSASLAQVHQARLVKENKIVAVKIQRPDIRPLIRADLNILAYIAGRLNELRTYQLYDLPGLVEELRFSLNRELDFTREARNMKIFSQTLSYPDLMVIPEVFDAYTTPYVLTMELVEGTRVDRLDDSTVNREQLARNGARIMLDQMLRQGFFHADPHQGNLLVLEDGRLCFLDWGMTGRITRDLRHRLIELIQALIQKDSETILRLIPHLTSDVPSDINHNRLERDLLDLIDSYYDFSLKEIQIGELVLSLMNLLNEHRLRIRSDFALMSRAILALEGLGKELAPNFNLIEEARILIAELVKERWSIKTLSEGLRTQGMNIFDLVQDLPARLQALFRKVDKGDLTFTFKHTGLSALNTTLERISNRVTFGIIIAALIVGSSMIITTGVKPLLFGFPALGVVGYLVSGILGLWLIINILRKKKF